MQRLRGRAVSIRETAAILLRDLPRANPPPPSRRMLEAVAAVEQRFGVCAAVARLPRWNAPGRVRQVGLWGARLADLAPRPLPPVLGEASAFNLAVALFDTVVDELPSALPPLAAALRPTELTRCLEHPDDCELELSTADHLDTIASLFGHALCGAGRRYREDPAARAELAGLLHRMYEAEIGMSAEPWLAKTLPVVWIGRLAGASAGSRAGDMFERLASFIARWDDAQDVRQDWFRGRYNVYLASGIRGAFRLNLMLGGLLRLPDLTRQIRADLCEALLDTLAAADRCGRRRAVAAFLAELVGGAA